MGTFTLANIRPGRGARRWVAVVAVVVLSLTLVLAFAAVALAASGDTQIPTAAGKTPPELDYTFSWLTFGGTFALVIVYYIFIFRVSETEFKKVVDAHFGPKE
jgi:hypothetical protein